MAWVKKYILHHLWLGLVMIIEAAFLYFREIYLWFGIYLLIGLFLFVDDLLAETIDKSIMKRLPDAIQEETRLKLIGMAVFFIQFSWFLYLIVTTTY
ncbi:MAG: hypothetical protein ACTSRS_14050 [Candidatus Helarchaeota archaeon]